MCADLVLARLGACVAASAGVEVDFEGMPVKVPDAELSDTD